ncbi:putative membrane protein [Mesorhizobium sp. J18]|uniref:heparan-alpha-glucosaminide N-acetyltransferase n=1 Tax=Mesorhizobium sp. J18 TaxID=935263 RepID=UPI00119A250F|nr:DUF1624 domain-containing protein [Mesorhizobium sp. J18]TWG95468.1 putative membrane protein [Mesorhizobium sp. J18]
MQPAASDKPRLELIDIARGLALVAMAIYHFGWDLEFFGYMDVGTTAHGGWRLFARCIASSFLFLVGVGLFLAHGRAIHWPSFGRRLLMIAAAAAAISAVTWFAVPNGFIFFGILHQIALASVLGLLFLRVPVWLTVIVAVFIIAAPNYLRSPFFDHPVWWWVGLSSTNPRANDYVPLFPWFGAVLLGIATARIAAGAGLFDRNAPIRTGNLGRPLIFLGRHSLAFYLVHQPVLIACVWLIAQVWPAPTQSPQANFMQACDMQCTEAQDSAFCTRYCSCALAAVEEQGLLGEIFVANPSEETRTRMNDISLYCTNLVSFPPAPESGNE